ncbi:hypothetical protein [Schaalia sp. lx-100]|uniref:hypothetical protein n=1 Tax=Schaalia sp. lx-100 TaxID=2899081 RepID=UPI001E58CA11|nr:hypothetical protein [Schaalia sp. lx-100]MCD4557565.1 hypothetical protein [Schaalia sp. lx-100]
MVENRRPRRPAILTPAQTESLVGDIDPAQESALAHACAWAILNVSDSTFGPEVIQRLHEVIATEGVDIIAHIWARSPEFTLPGALWRSYLFHEWCVRDLHVVTRLYELGLQEYDLGEYETRHSAGSLNALLNELEHLFAGQLTDDDLENLLLWTSSVMRIIAAGNNPEGSWIEDITDPLAYPVTLRSHALVRTAEELERSAQEAAHGRLE